MSSRLKFAFTGEEGGTISPQQATLATQLFQELYPARCPSYFLSTSTLDTLLSTPTCVGIRVYFALTNAGEERLIAVGTGADANDFLAGPIAASAPDSAHYPFPTLSDWAPIERLQQTQTYSLELPRAAELTANFRAHNGGQTWGVFWGRQRMTPYLVESECTGLRFYPYANNAGQVSMLYTAVNVYGVDMFDPFAIGAEGCLCPGTCSTGVDLYGFSLAIENTPPTINQLQAGYLASIT